MTDKTWRTLGTAIRGLENLPKWLRNLADMPYEHVSGLPKRGSEASGEAARPHVTEEPMEKDYLDFLREQIRLEPRGPEWTKVLTRRLDALQPYVGRKVILADLYHDPHRAALYVNPEGGQVILAEID